jgi:hypothetical protein
MGLTYADKSIAAEVLKLSSHKIAFPVPNERPAKDAFGREFPSTSTVEDDNSVMINVQVSKRSLSDYIKSRMNDMLRTNNSTQSQVNQKMLRGFEGFRGELRKLWGVVDENTREEKARHLMRDKMKNGKSGLPSERRVDMTVDRSGQGDLVGDQRKAQGLLSAMTQMKEAPGDYEGIQSVASIEVPLGGLSDRLGEAADISGIRTGIEGTSERHDDFDAALLGTSPTIKSIDGEGTLELPIDRLAPATENRVPSSETDVANPTILPTTNDMASSATLTSSPQSNQADVVGTPTITSSAVSDTEIARTESLLDSILNRLTSSANHFASTNSAATTLRMDMLNDALGNTSSTITALKLKLLEDQSASTTSGHTTLSSGDIPDVDPISLEPSPTSPFSGVDPTKSTETPPETPPSDTGNPELATVPRKRGRPRKYQE